MKHHRSFFSLPLSCLLLLSVLLPAFPAARARENVSTETAARIEVNQLYTETDLNYYDNAYYKFKLASDGFITFDLMHKANDDPYESMIMTLYTDTMDRLCEISMIGKESKVTSQELGLPAGSYYLVAGNYDRESDAAFQFRVNYEASDAWETELNESTETADPIMVNKLYSASIRDKQESDYFKFSLPADGYITFDLMHKAFDDPYECMLMVLYTDTMDRLCEISMIGKESKVTSQELGLPAGTYYLYAGAYDNYSSATYQLRVNYKASDAWETERNDDRETADLIAVNKLYSASIRDKSEDDCFKFRLPADGFITYDLMHEAFDDPYDFWRMSLYTDTMDKLCEITTVGKESKVSSPEIGLPAGTYYLYAGAYDNFSAATYQFRVNFTAADRWETERNDDKETADLIETNKLYSASICSEDERDYYRFRLPSDCEAALLFEHQTIDEPYESWNVTLYSDRMDRIADITVPAKESRVQSENIRLSAGTYYLYIRADDAYYADTYHLSVLTSDGMHLYRIGDINLDGEITAEDARLALRAAVQLENFPVGSPQFIAGDTDRKGEITAWDARRILRAAVGLEELS